MDFRSIHVGSMVKTWHWD